MLTLVIFVALNLFVLHADDASALAAPASPAKTESPTAPRTTSPAAVASASTAPAAGEKTPEEKLLELNASRQSKGDR